MVHRCQRMRGETPCLVRRIPGLIGKAPPERHEQRISLHAEMERWQRLDRLLFWGLLLALVVTLAVVLIVSLAPRFELVLQTAAAFKEQ